MILVTAYTNPDLDGTACAISYAEFLRKKKHDAVAGIFGTPHREAEFVFKTFSISRPRNADTILTDKTKIIICDASDLNGISKKIKPSHVIEIIDHRKVNEAEKFPNAKVQIELVGSAATLIAEKFYQKKIPVSQSSATLLYSAIISNTVNFKNNVTTERDKKMARWLQKQIDIPENYVHTMFAHKSIFDTPLKDIFIADFASYIFNHKKLSIAQLEIIDVEKFVATHQQKINQALQDIKTEQSLDHIFLTCIDVEKGFNQFVVIDKETEKLLEATLSVTFHNGIARHEGIIMRKEIVPLIKSFLI